MSSAATCRLPDGRAFSAAPEIAAVIRVGVIVMEPVVGDERDGPAVAAAVLGEELRTLHEGRKPSEIPGLAEARNLYKAFGMEPTRHRPSSEALLRRTLQGKDLYRISNLVDSCNLASLTFLLPIGMYDLDAVQGDVVMRLGKEGEEYPGIRKGPVHLGGRLGFFDDAGPFGSPTSDSARTCTGESTTRILAVVMATAAVTETGMDGHLDVFADIFTRHCDGQEALRAVLGGGS